MNWVSIGSDNGLSPIRREAIIKINAWVIANWTLRNKLKWNYNQNTTNFIQENSCEKIVCETTTISSTGTWVKATFGLSIIELEIILPNELLITCHTHCSYALQSRDKDRYGVSSHQPHHCLLNRLLKRRSKKTSKLHITGLCEVNSPVTSEFSAQRASNAEMFPFGDVIMVSSGIYQLHLWLMIWIGGRTDSKDPCLLDKTFSWLRHFGKQWLESCL